MKKYLFVFLIIGANFFSSAQTSNYFNGFETSISPGWNAFSPAFHPVRIASGTNSITSASGEWHAELSPAGGPGGPRTHAATNFGGYNSEFPAPGYSTFLDFFLNVDGGWANDTRVHYVCAISTPSGSHRRDFAFIIGFYNDGTGPGAGTDRFVISASPNSGRANSYPKDPGRGPISISTSGWYTFEHKFYDNGSGVLAVDLNIFDKDGILINSWTLSDPTDIIGSTVGGNRYGWVYDNEFSILAIDNSALILVPDCDLSVDAGTDATVYFGYSPMATTQLTATVTGASGNVTYSWVPADGLSDPSISNPVASPIVTTTYVVTATDENDCVASDTVTVKVVDVRCGNKNDKVLICHNGKTLCVSPNAIPAHLAHGDALGDCSGLSKQPGDYGEDIASIPDEFMLHQNYPNPFNPSTTVSYQLAADSPVRLDIFNSLGQLVQTLVNETQSAGYYSVEWNADGFASGIYFLKMTATDFTSSQKLILMK